jgi:hypothetical protein
MDCENHVNVCHDVEFIDILQWLRCFSYFLKTMPVMYSSDRGVGGTCMDRSVLGFTCALHVGICLLCILFCNFTVHFVLQHGLTAAGIE